MTVPGRPRKLALVLWTGEVGGAEVLSVDLAERARTHGTEMTFVLVGTPASPWLAERLAVADIACISLELGRGRNVLRHLRRYARAVAEAGPNGALLTERGLMAAALRLGGYRGPIVAVEHGAFLAEKDVLPLPRQLLRKLGRVAGARAADVQVAVSEFMLEQMLRSAHGRHTARIYNATDPDVYRVVGDQDGANPDELVIGFAGRLVGGKGVDQLISSLALVRETTPARLLIAGDGPEHSSLIAQVRWLNLVDCVEFLGVVDDIPAFWGRCDVAVVPSDTWRESFSMVTLEAMSCGKAVVASREGAIPELVLDGVTGSLVPPGDPAMLGAALIDYAHDPALRARHGQAGRARAIACFHIEACTRAYLELFEGLVAARGETLASDAS